MNYALMGLTGLMALGLVALAPQTASSTPRWLGMGRGTRLWHLCRPPLEVSLPRLRLA
jgi:hypothetical protein